MDIPFENSLFQDEAFIINMSYTDARALRSVTLKLSTKLQALRELEHKMEETKIDLDEIESKMEYTRDKFQLRRFELDKKRKLSSQLLTKKLLKDALYEVEYLRAVMSKLPNLTRREFEEQEFKYFTESLTRQAMNMPESHNSLRAMGHHGEQLPAINFEEPSVTERLGATIKEFLVNAETNVKALMSSEDK
jgi:hypothetical protein